MRPTPKKERRRMEGGRERKERGKGRGMKGVRGGEVEGVGVGIA